MNHKYLSQLEESAEKLRLRIKSGNWEFGDHRRLKELRAEMERVISGK